MKVGDLVRLLPEHYEAFMTDSWFFSDRQKQSISKSYGIIVDENPKYFFVQQFSNPVYSSENIIAHLKTELQLISESDVQHAQA